MDYTKTNNLPTNPSRVELYPILGENEKFSQNDSGIRAMS
jgi:hypothetical protein